MAPIQSSEGVKSNWLNYKTGIKYIRFNMDADNREVSVTILMDHPQEGMRKIHYDKFLQLRSLFTNMVQGSWQWQENAYDENGRIVSKIYTTLSGVNVFDQNTWPAIISFLKQHVIALDEFWSNVKDGFEQFE